MKNGRRDIIIHLLLLLLLVTSTHLFALNAFDGEVAGVYDLPDDVFEERELKMKVGQLMLLREIPHYSPLIDGIEITITPPSSIQTGGSAFALYVFHDVSSRSGMATADLQSGSIGNLQGERILFELLPSRSSFSIRIPTRSDHQVRGGIDSRVTPAVVETGIAITILPVMKGLPSEVLNQPFTLTTRPLLTAVGGLELSAVTHDNRPIDNAVLDEMGLTVELDRYGSIQLDERVYIRPGIYQVVLNREGILFDATQVGVERGTNQHYVITLPRPKSTVRFTVPDFVTIRLNGEQIDDPSISLPPGEYSVELSFETYQKQYDLTVQAGRHYDFTVGLEVLLESQQFTDLQVE